VRLLTTTVNKFSPHVSIHVLARGATRRYAPIPLLNIVSIQARTERAKMTKVLPDPISQFQSTRLHGARLGFLAVYAHSIAVSIRALERSATSYHLLPPISIVRFYPRAPMERDSDFFPHGTCVMVVSIRAPLWNRPSRYHQAAVSFQFQSTHL